MVLGKEITVAQNLNDSLLLHYPLNGNAVDISGNNYNGTASGTLVYTADRAGNPGYAALFNGSNTFIDLPNIAALKPQLPVSVSMWIRPDTLNVPSVIFTNDFQNNNYHGFWINYNVGSGTVSCSFGDGSGTTGASSRRTKTGTIALTKGVWSHVVVVIRGSQDMDIYIDCVKDQGTYSGSGGTLAYSNVAGSVGRHDTDQGLPPWYFRGAIDDLRFWDRSLQESEVTLLCEQVPTAGEPPQTDKIVIFPNPASGDAVRLRAGATEITSLTLCNLTGQALRHSRDGQTLDLTGLAAGYYVVILEDVEGQTHREQLIRQR